MKRSPLLVALTAAVLSFSAHATKPSPDAPRAQDVLGVESISAALAASPFAHPDRRVTGVRAIAPGWAEVLVASPAGNLVFYATPTHLIFGSLVDRTTGVNLTEQRQGQINAVTGMDTWPRDKAIVRVRGKGERVLYSFEDPECGYCKKFAEEIEKLDNVTVVTYLTPILSPDSATRARAIWCAPDRAAALSGWMLRGETPPAPAEACQLPDIGDVVKAAKPNGTPTLILPSGVRVVGMRPAAVLEGLLNAKAP